MAAAGTIVRLVPSALTVARKLGCPLAGPNVATSGGRGGGNVTMKVSTAMLAALRAAAPSAKLRQKARLCHKLSRGAVEPRALSERAMRFQVRAGGVMGSTSSASLLSRSSQYATALAKA